MLRAHYMNVLHLTSRLSKPRAAGFAASGCEWPLSGSELGFGVNCQGYRPEIHDSMEVAGR
jgi:hypothetical protein